LPHQQFECTFISAPTVPVRETFKNGLKTESLEFLRCEEEDIKMDILPSGNIFSELERICTTGYYSSQPSIEDQWQQVS